MKDMFKGLGGFLVGLAKLILICGAVVFLVRGLDWFFEKTLPLKAIGIPSLALSIIVLCLIVLIVIWVDEKRARKRPVKKEQNTMTRGEIHEARVNSNRGWLCLLTGFWVLMMTPDMDDMRERLALCSIAAVATWPVTVVKKIKKRPGLCAGVLLAVWLIYFGGHGVWSGMTHVGPGLENVDIGGSMGWSGYEPGDTEEEEVTQSEYRRQCYTNGVMLFLVGAGIFWGVIGEWKKQNELEKSGE